MWIRDQNEERIFNTDRIDYIYRTGSRIGVIVSGKEWPVGKYKTDDRAEAVFDELQTMFHDPCAAIVENIDISELSADELKRMLNCNNISCFDTNSQPQVTLIHPSLYVMPEE